jgi:hypothetical protein
MIDVLNQVSKGFIVRQVVVGFLGFLILTSCSSHDEAYYQQHPEQLQALMQACPAQAPSSSVSCERLGEVASRIDALAYELQQSPQRFGQSILNLQSEIAFLKQHPEEKGLIEQKMQELQLRLVIVRWLESPES